MCGVTSAELRTPPRDRSGVLAGFREVQPGAEIALACGHGANGAGEVGEDVVFQRMEFVDMWIT
jgi:hypothetical protein